MSDNSYLIKPHKTYVVKVPVPRELRAKLKRSAFKKSLKTDSLAVANRLKHAHIAAFQARIEAARRDKHDPDAYVYRLGLRVS